VRRSFLAIGIAALSVVFGSIVHAQTPITTFAEVAGKWKGQTAPSVYRFTLEIDPSGRFKAQSLLGNESGVAKLEGGTIVIPLVEHQGELQLALVGDRLSGPGMLRSRKGSVSLTREGSDIARAP